MKKNLKILTGLLFAMIMGCFLATSADTTSMLITGIVLFSLSQIPLPKGVALMAITYNTDCEDEAPAHTCDECDDPELARVRGIALIKNSFAFTDPTSYTEWRNGILAGDIIIIPFTHGSFDGGTPKEGTGYGDQATKYVGTDYSLTFFDPNYKVNRDFYNSIKRFQGYKLAYKTETLVHITDKPAQILPKAPVADDITGEVVWEVQAKWSSQNEPSPYVSPDGIFICFSVE